MGNQGCCQSREQNGNNKDNESQNLQCRPSVLLQQSILLKKKQGLGENQSLCNYLEAMRQSQEKNNPSLFPSQQVHEVSLLKQSQESKPIDPIRSFGDILIDDIILQIDPKFNPFDDKWVNLYEENDIKIYAFQWIVEKNSIINVTRGEYIIKCSPQEFISLNNDLTVQKKFDTKIEQFEKIETNQLFLESQYYLCYKGMFVVQGRDFVYLKKVKQVSKSKDIWFEVSRSIENDNYGAKQKKVRGFINLSGLMVQPLINESQSYQHIKDPEAYSLIRTFSDIDVKLNIPLMTAQKQIVNEMKIYIERFRKQVEVNL